MATKKTKRSSSYPYQVVSTIAEFLNRFVPRQSTKGSDKYIPYGQSNDLPQEIISLIASNGVALRAMRLRSKYINGYGFADEAIGQAKANRKESMNELLSKIKTDMSLFQGFALQVIRTGDGAIGEVHHLPIEMVRKSPDGHFVINETVGTNEEKDNWVKYPAYRGKSITTEQLAAQIVEFGKKPEVAYFYDKDAISFDYPIPDWFASEFDIRTGTELMLLDNEMVTNGFMPSAVMTFVGGVDDTTEDEDGLTAADHRDRLLRQFTGNQRDPLTGKSSRMRLLTFDVDTKEEAPVLETFNIEKIVTGSIEKRDDINRQICRLFGLHPVLLGYTDPTVLGNQQALANASEQAAQDVEGEQALIKEAFSDLFEGDFTISKFMPMSYISDKLLDDLSPEERRALIGYEPMQVNEDANKKIIDTLNGLSPLLAASIVKAMKPEALLELVGIDKSNAVEEIPPDTGGANE